MARVTDGLLGDFQPCMTLDRYQEVMQLPISAFNGLIKVDEYPKNDCASVWNQTLRDNVAIWISIAEQNRETELGYHLAPKWISGEEHEYNTVVMLHKKHLISVGNYVEYDVELGSTITHRDVGGNILDPVVLVIDAGAEYTASDIIITYPGEDVHIRPSKISISGTVITIHIPRSRLVKPELNDDRLDHLYYEDDVNFLETVDVKRTSIVLEGGIQFVWYSGSDINISTIPHSTEYTQYGYYYTKGARANRISSIYVYPATFVDGVPESSGFTYGLYPGNVRISYLSGIRISPMHELLTARYAHTLMPNIPCTCPIVAQYWSEDRKVIDGMYTPYGNMQGAMNAWMIDSRNKVGISGVFPGMRGAQSCL